MEVLHICHTLKNIFTVLWFSLLYSFARISKSLGCVKYTKPAISTGQASEKQEAHLDTENFLLYGNTVNG